ncbi:hypothetical protein JD844_007572, partial [Phrynosoma platyrhinos]
YFYCFVQVQNLTLRSQKLGVLSSSQNGSPKSSSQAQTLSACPNKPITSTKASQSDPPESKRKGDSPTTELRGPAVTRTSSIHQLIAPASYSPIQPHSLLKHQQSSLHSPPSKISHHQLIFQQQQVQPIALQLPPNQETSPSQHCVPLQSHALPPPPSSTTSQHCTPIHIHPPLPPPLSPTPSQSSQQSVVVSPAPPPSPSQSPTIIIHPQALIQSQSHQLASSALQSEHNQAQVDGSPTEPVPQSANLPPQLPSSPVVHIGSADPPSIVSAGQQMTSPTAHPQYPALQPTPIPVATSPQLSTSPTHSQPLPLPPVQSLQVQPEILSQGQVLVQNTLVSEEELPAAEALVQLPFQTLPPPQTVAVNLHVQQAVPAETPVIYQVEEMCEEDIPEESDCVHMARTPTPPTLSPPAINREDLSYEEPFSEQEGHPSVASSVSASVIKSSSDPPHASIPQPPLLLPAVTTRSNSTPVSNRNPSVENKLPQAIVKPQILTHVIEGFVIQEGLEPFPVSVKCNEGLDEMETDLLKCEFCGKMGYANKFLRSKRFCTMSCAKRIVKENGYPVVCLYCIFQLPITYPSAEEDLASQEDSVPVAMTTRLRRQSERERERCQDIADEFRAQEIDGQALLLLKEDHLMSAMNIKLGPALKICARINSLKES